MNITTIGLDIAKNVFHMVGLDNKGKIVMRKGLRRNKLLAELGKLAPALVAMEACASSSYWGREIEKLGHSVKIIPAKYVKPFLQGQKNDFNDALAIAEAALRPKVHGVPIKTIAQQDMQSLHRIRNGIVKQRTALVNQIRGLLGEYGVTIAQGITRVRRAIPLLLEETDNGLTVMFRDMLSQLYGQLVALDEHEQHCRKHLKISQSQCATTQRLITAPGFGPVVASLFVCTLGDGKAFRRGRDVSAYLGLVPQQHSSGGKSVLRRISKQGNASLRTLLIHGARAVIQHTHLKKDALSRWVTRLVSVKGKNRAAVALANKMARIGWAIITTGQPYQIRMAA
jgi:transposase